MSEIELYRVAKEIGIQIELKSKFEHTNGDESKYTLGQMLLKLEFEDSAIIDLLFEFKRGKDQFKKALDKKKINDEDENIGKDIKALKKALSILKKLGVDYDTTRRIRNTDGESVNYNATYDYAKIQHIAPMPWLRIDVQKSDLYHNDEPLQYAFTPCETYINIIEIIQSLEKTVKSTKTIKDKSELTKILQATTDGANNYLSKAYNVTAEKYQTQLKKRFENNHTIQGKKKRPFITLVNQFFKTIK